MLSREELIHVTRRVEPLELLVAGQCCHDPDLELVKVDVSELRIAVRDDDRPISFRNVLQAGTSQLHARCARAEHVYYRSCAVGREGERAKYSARGAEGEELQGIATKVALVRHEL